MAESAFSAMVWGRPVDPSTVGGISDLRNIDLNLFYLIKEKILPVNGYVGRYTETVQPATQEVDPITGNVVTPFYGTYNDWVYYNPDPSNPALTGLLTTATISSSGDYAYTNYPGGAVYFSGTKTDAITMTYDYYTVYVQDGFPDWGDDPKDWDEIRIPLVSVEHRSRTNQPFAIGGRYEEDRMFAIDVLGNADPQRDDLADLIETSLRYDYPMSQDYKLGFPIDFRGDVNSSFDRGSASRWLHLRFEDTDSRVMHNYGAPDKLRHHAYINLKVRTN